MENMLLQATFYLGAAVLIVPISVRLGLGSVLGYLAAGLLLGPALGLAGSETHDLQHFAEFGVVLMLFLIGLELEPRTLWDMRHKLLGLGGLQVTLTAGLVAGLLLAMDEPWRVAVALGLLFALSSTAIVLQTLTEKNLLRTAGGRSTFAVLLSQDIAVVPMLALIPLMALRSTPKTAEEGAAQPIMSLVQSLPGWAVTGLTLGIVVAIVLAGHFLSRPVFRFIHASRLPEMGTFVSLLMVIGIAFLMMLVGLSPALGSFIAGVVLANSEFRHQIEADIKPFKGILMGLFFTTVGVNIDMGLLADQPLRILALTVLLMLAKAGVLFLLATLFRVRGRDRMLFTLGLAQAGEFGFLIVSFAVAQGILPDMVAQRALLVISLSMLLTPLLFILHDRLARRATKGSDAPADVIDEKGTVIIAGIGRFGQVVNRMARTAGLSTVVLDSDAAAIERLRRFGIKGYFGDPARPDLLQAAGLAEAQVLVVAVDGPENATRIVQFARRQRPDLHIVARAYDRVHVYELFRAGANDILRETFDASVRAGRYVLENMGFTEYEAAKLSQTYYKVDRAALRDLAELWVPGQPIHQNEAYVARARQLDEDLRTALLDDQDEITADRAAQ
ncbi:potassium transporter [Gemmobacter lutimaris]|uniref:Potassium transporter n=1 Tax=Gemmobacter lutimaris TaxID=2306023 RepID=A0A398BW33_9RHOB|nr:cation:proton antiporter [Gemmobacter lutimaris]RID93131.1 potassium transporter [Gemmobacter lutimaris]